MLDRTALRLYWNQPTAKWMVAIDHGRLSTVVLPFDEFIKSRPVLLAHEVLADPQSDLAPAAKIGEEPKIRRHHRPRG
jgi:hypothetical protein